ncbi:hypothetical protein SAMN04490355_107219 [Pelosinus propionicus DSM 13327]|uniref:Transmembrane protein n=1 Tax=Pelosinus propionicus DSM 13327 TaxID=1123291 RepID=A0A1I4PTA2_9FIRM|nr:hypothetical protein SAMN04490355_107219 [Pelosinus propionicus DSM 13327]
MVDWWGMEQKRLTNQFWKFGRGFGDGLFLDFLKALATERRIFFNKKIFRFFLLYNDMLCYVLYQDAILCSLLVVLTLN